MATAVQVARVPQARQAPAKARTVIKPPPKSSGMAEAAVLGGLTLLLLIGGGAAAAYFTSANDKPVAIKGSFGTAGGADYGASGSAVAPQQRTGAATTRP